MSVTARVQKHRYKLKMVRRRRLEVHLPSDLVEVTYKFAQQHERYVRDVIYSALLEYLTLRGAHLPSTLRR